MTWLVWHRRTKEEEEVLPTPSPPPGDPSEGQQMLKSRDPRRDGGEGRLPLQPLPCTKYRRPMALGPKCHTEKLRCPGSCLGRQAEGQTDSVDLPGGRLGSRCLEAGPLPLVRHPSSFVPSLFFRTGLCHRHAPGLGALAGKYSDGPPTPPLHRRPSPAPPLPAPPPRHCRWASTPASLPWGACPRTPAWGSPARGPGLALVTRWRRRRWPQTPTWGTADLAPCGSLQPEAPSPHPQATGVHSAAVTPGRFREGSPVSPSNPPPCL